MNLKHKCCAQSGCPAIHTEPGEYCRKHTKKKVERRPSATERGYGYEWQKESRKYLRAHPWCECPDCKKSGKPFPVAVVDHIVPHKGDMRRFWDRRNWQAMAQVCHNRKTVEKDGGFGR